MSTHGADIVFQMPDGSEEYVTWPHVPRVGDTVVLACRASNLQRIVYDVTGVRWVDKDDVRVRLLRSEEDL